MPPREVHGNSLEGVDEWEEEVMDEELLAGRVKGVEALHQTDQSITEFVLALAGNAGVLEEGDEKLHDL